jgi:hypothetical protein
MQKKLVFMALAILWTGCLQTQGQVEVHERQSKKWFVGSSLLLLGNLIPDDANPPEYIQLNVGYRLTSRDVVQFRFKRSIYAWPLGIPFGRILAPQIGYQRFWWNGLHTSVYILNAFEKYMDEDGKKIGNGFTLYTDFYLGYQFKFFKNRFFFEPAIGVSYWPLRTGVPDAFKAAEHKWPNRFIQPGLDFGFNF